MELGIGVDIVEIERISSALYDPAKPLDLVLTQREMTNSVDTQTLAGILAAKEALVKASSLLIEFSPLDVEVSHYANGKPCFIFNSTSFNRISKCDLTISHTDTVAIAVVLCLLMSNIDPESGN